MPSAFSNAFSSSFDSPSGGNAPSIYDELGSGGAVGGGRAPLIGIGGLEWSGTADVTGIKQAKKMQGGVVAGGRALLIGGLEWGGTAAESSNWATYRTQGGAAAGGSAAMGYHFPLFTPVGGPVVDGSARSRQHYIHVVTGAAIIGGRIAGATNTIGFDLTFLWSVNSAITADFSFQWNAGTLPMYYYRVVGKPRDTSLCPPIKSEPCCKQFTVNVPARSIADLCEKLRAMKWKWPIDTVDRWSRPAENANVSADDQCNILEPVQICKNIACLDVCVDYDETLRMGFSMTAQLQKMFHYDSQGLLHIFGDASYSMEIYRPEFRFVPEGGPQIVAEEVDVNCSNFGYWASDVPVQITGEANLSAEYWRFVAGEWPLATDRRLPVIVDTAWDGSHAPWSNAGNILNVGGGLATCALSATTSRFSNFIYVKDFNLNVPEDAIITGLEIGITRKVTKGCRDWVVCLTHGSDITSDNLAKDIYWPIDYGTGDGVETLYGGHGVSWRNEESVFPPLTPQEVNDPEFGIGFQVWGSSTLSDNIASVDNIQIRVYYQSAVGQVVRVSGSAPFRSTNYMHIVEGAARVGGSSPVLRISGRVLDVGMGPSGRSAVIIGGAGGMDYSFEPSGGITVSGFSPSQQAHGIGSPAITVMHMNGGMQTSGEARIFPYWEIAEGGLRVGNKSVLFTGTFRYIPDGGPVVGGEFKLLSAILRHRPNGLIQTGGEAECSSTVWRYLSEGNPPIAVGGSAQVNVHEVAVSGESFGSQMTVYDLRVVRPVQAATGTLTAITGVVKRCGCNALPYQLLLKHNLVQNNRFAQFLVRNRKTYPNGLSLFYGDKEDSWQANEHYRGLAADGRAAETWNLVYELKCSSEVAAARLGTRLWQFSLQVVQKNLLTLQSFESKFGIYFVPGQLCSATGTLSFVVYYDTVMKTGHLKPTAVIYDALLRDGIGLFKTPQWFKEPLLQIQISQKSLIYADPTYHIDALSTVATTVPDGTVAPAAIPPITLVQGT